MVDAAFSTSLGTGTLECNMHHQMLEQALESVEDCCQHISTEVMKRGVRVVSRDSNFVALFVGE